MIFPSCSKQIFLQFPNKGRLFFQEFFYVLNSFLPSRHPLFLIGCYTLFSQYKQKYKHYISLLILFYVTKKLCSFIILHDMEAFALCLQYGGLIYSPTDPTDLKNLSQTQKKKRENLYSFYIEICRIFKQRKYFLCPFLLRVVPSIPRALVSDSHLGEKNHRTVEWLEAT